LFSIITGWPSDLPSSVATRRVTKSVVPPGVKGTTTRIGLAGQAWAPATSGNAALAPARMK
jgi:hypothetical protein